MKKLMNLWNKILLPFRVIKYRHDVIYALDDAIELIAFSPLTGIQREVLRSIILTKNKLNPIIEKREEEGP